MNPYQKFALDHYLSVYPENMTFHDILELVEDPEKDENGDVLVWDPFFHLEPEEVGGLISDLAHDLSERFIAKEELQTKIAEGLKH